jgi:hypothetical protein
MFTKKTRLVDVAPLSLPLLLLIPKVSVQAVVTSSQACNTGEGVSNERK